METPSRMNGKSPEEKKEWRIMRLALLAFRDELTHLFNRRYLRFRFPRILERAGKNRERVYLLLIDVDDFKKINDCYFHCEGDRVLVEVAHLLKRGTRPKDIVVRYGGDEFVVILQDTDSTEARKIASRWIQEAGSIRVGDPRRVSVTLSVGIASFPTQAETVETLIHEADQALYHTKRNGENGLSSKELHSNISLNRESSISEEFGFLTRHFERSFS